MFTFSKARWAKRKKTGKKIMQLKWPKYQKPKDENMGWTSPIYNLSLHSIAKYFVTTDWHDQQHVSYALSFYGSKMILDRPNNFGRVPIVLDRFNLFLLGLNNFGQLQIIKISPEKSNLNLTKTIWTLPKQYGPYQNNLDLTKTIWTVQNHFGSKSEKVNSIRTF